MKKENIFNLTKNLNFQNILQNYIINQLLMLNIFQ